MKITKFKKIVFTSIVSLLLYSCDSFLNISSLDKNNFSFKGNTSSLVSSEKQSINYSDSNMAIYNPDIGFYSCVKPIIKKSAQGQSASCELSSSSWNKTKFLPNGKYPTNADSNDYKFDLIHVIVDISSFSGNINEIEMTDSELADGKAKGKDWHVAVSRNDEKLGKDLNMTVADLKGVDALLDKIYKENKTAIIRFSYDPKNDGKKIPGTDKYYDVEPKDFNTILQHIEVICKVLANHTDAITAVEMGMLGPYGEIHSTYFAEQKNDGDKYVVLVMEKFLNSFNANGINVPFLVRRPRFIDNYIKTHSADKRIGLYNDGYLGSKSDLGTFKDRTEIKNEYTEKIPYGGELCWDSNTKDSDDYAYWREGTLQAAVNEMPDIHLSFLNIGWNNHVLAWADSDNASHSWTSDEKTYKISGKNKCTNPITQKEEKLFQIILKHMGYRYLVTESVFDYYSDKKSFGVNLKIKNNGFANLPFHRAKDLKVYLIPKGRNPSSADKPVEVNLPKFTGQESLSFFVPCDTLSGGEYIVYLKVCDSNGSHAIQFANDGEWNDTLKAFKIGVFKN